MKVWNKLYTYQNKDLLIGFNQFTQVERTNQKQRLTLTRNSVCIEVVWFDEG